jgi:putative DNA primase/helicase
VIDFAAIAQGALGSADALLPELFPQGRRQGREFCVGNLSGAKGDSLKVNLETGVWSDFASGEKGGGDLISLWARARGCNNAEAAREIAKRLGRSFSNGNGEHSVLTVDQYAEAKGFTVDFLKANGVAQESRGVLFRYFNPDGSPAPRHKLRLTLDKGEKRRFEYFPAQGDPLGLYGLALLAEARKGRTLHIVEGETDWLTMIAHGLPALALPGANTAKKLAHEHLVGFGEVFVHCDNDRGGDAFVQGVVERLKAVGFDGEARVVRYQDLKDPGELHVKNLGDPGGFEVALDELLGQSEHVFGHHTGDPSLGKSTATDAAIGDANLEIRPPGFSDDAIAERFADRFSATLRYVAQWHQWFVYDGASWHQEHTLYAFDRVRAICREIAAGVPEDNLRMAANIASAKTVAAVEHLARSDRRHAAVVDQWDRDPMLLNTPTGAINLMTGELRPNRSEDFCTKITAVGPSDHADCPLWLHFLARIFAENGELVAYITRLAGYVLTGSTIEQHFNFFYGPGANGKGVLMITLLGILGNYATSTPTETFMAAKTDRHPTELADLLGARLVTASETEKGRRWAETRLKNITGGDPIKARFMRGDFFEYVPQFKLLLAGNQRPRLSAVDEAIRRRIHLIPFTVIIPQEQRDKHLAEKLKAEWPAILRWMIQGCRDWQAKGLNPPATVRDATEAYLDAEDTVGEWIARECEEGKSYQATIGDLFKSWKQFAEAADEFVGNRRALADELEKRGYRRHRIGHARHKGFLGLKLKEFSA